MTTMAVPPTSPPTAFAPPGVPATSRPLRMIQVLPDGSVSTESISLPELKRSSGLQAGDMLVLDEGGRMPHYRILPRRRCIILTLGSLRGLIFHDKVLLLPVLTPTGERRAIDFANRVRDAILAVTHSAELHPNGGGSAPSTGGPAGVSVGVGATGAAAIGSSSAAPSPSAASTPGGSSALEGGSGGDRTPFEFLVLSEALRVTYERQTRRIAYCRPLADRTLQQLGSNPDQLFTLFPVKNTLQHFQSTSEALMVALKNVLGDSRDMHEACLSEKRAKGGIHHVGEETLFSLEIMLETYHQLISETNQASVELLRNIQTKQDILNTQLDAYRNHLMGLNLKLSILGIGIGSGTLISGVFGMNLASGLETAPFVFWGVAGLSAALIGVFYRAYGHYARMTSPSGRHMSRVSTFLATTDADRIPSAPARSPKSPRLLRFLDWFLGLRKGFTATANPVGEPGLDDLRLTVPSTIAAGADPVRLTRVQFRALYSASIGRAISDDELDLIFSIFDADNDGHLSIDEVLGVVGSANPAFHADTKAPFL